MRRHASGVWTGGLHTIVLPVARAGARNSAMIISGKFHGVIAAQTPTGWRYVKMRLSRSTLGIVEP